MPYTTTYVHENIRNPKKSIYDNICNMDQVKVKC